MKPVNASRESPVRKIAVVVLLILLGAFVMLITGGGATQFYAPVLPGTSMSPDDRVYVEFVYPRLAELVDETTVVTALVREKSRNVLELNRRGNRITDLASEITVFGNKHDIPKRFALVDGDIRDGMTLETGAIDKARQALVRFRFDSISVLVPEFASGRDKLSGALADLNKAIDGQATSWGTMNG